MVKSGFRLGKALYGGYFYDLARDKYKSYSNKTQASINRAGRVAKSVAQAAIGPAVKRATGSNLLAAVASGAARGMLMPRRRQYTSGFFTGKIKGRRFRRSRRQKKLARFFKGVNWNNEVTSVVTDDKCVYLMHSTFPALTFMKYTIYSLFKNILNQGGIQFNAFTDARQTRIGTGDTFIIEWKANVSSAPVATGYTVVLGDVTYQNVADGLWLSVYNNLINNVAGFTSRGIILRAYWQTFALEIPSELNLQGSYVSFVAKSALKMQNRSVNVAGDEEIDVNNVPLYGKGYDGKGNGFVTKSNNVIMTPCDGVNGWNTFAAGAGADLQEPPQLYSLQYAKGMKTLYIPSGGIKTSVLYEKQTISLQILLRTLNGLYFQATDTEQFHRLGKVRMYALERPIAKIGAELGINVTAEHDYKLWVELHNKKGMYTGPINTVL